ncbi:hypothetical protein D3C80_1477120 [compost metagenome]
MTGDQVFHFAGGQAMTRNVDDIVGAPHDVDEAVFIQITAIAGVVIARIRGEVGVQVTLVIAPQGLAAAWRQWQGNHNGALLVGAEQLAFVVQHAHVIPRHCAVARTGSRRATVQPDTGRSHRPAGFGLPPVVMHSLAAGVLQPLVGTGVELLAGQEQLTQGAQVIAAQQFAFRVFLADRAHGRWRAEQPIDPVLLHYPPVGTGIRGANWLALVEHRGAAAHQRPVDDQ